MKRFFKQSIVWILLLGMTAGLIACDSEDPQTNKKGVVISEVSTSNGKSYEDAVYGSPDWIELHNESDRAVNLLGWSITDNVKNSDKACTLPEIMIPADGYLLLLATKQEKTDALAWDGNSPICLGFSLKATGETLVLADENMKIVDTLDVPELGKDISYARRSDGTFGYCEQPTPGKANDTEILKTPPAPSQAILSPVTGVQISEISSRNTLLSCGGCESCDWVELFNTTDADISLEGFTLCDDPSDFDDANLSGVLPANGYLIVFCCSDTCETKQNHVCIDLGISRYGDMLYLYDPNGFELEKVSVPEIPYKDVTYARRSDGTFGYCEMPTPGEANLSEITNIPPQKSEELPEQPDDGETFDPTKHATRPTSVRISEALAKNAYSINDRDGDRSDWVELYNTTGKDIDLSGYYLSDNPNSLLKWAFPQNTVIPAKGYLLVFLSGKTNVEGELHASFSLGEGETLFLYCTNDHTLDWVTIPNLPDNVSVGLDENNEQVYYRYPTPMAPNGHAEKDAEAIGFFPSDGVYISEVCAIHDRGSGENDWIELFNGGSSAVTLDGWYLSDSADNLKKYRISSLTVQAGAYAVIETSSNSKSDSVAPFGISPNGETLYLTDPNGTVIDAFETGVQRNGMSNGRIEGEEQVRRVFFTKKTKGKQNSTEYYTGITNEPTFSETALYQKETFTLTLHCLNPNAVIYYTTNGSEPTIKSKRYSGPIEIKKNTVIRAVAVAEGLLNSEIVTYHYLFVEPHTVPVVCIALSPDDFETVYDVKVHRDIKGTERKAYFNYYESDGKIGVCFPADLRCRGQSTLKYKQKSFSVHLRGQYGMATVNYPLFENYPFTEFGSLVLRNGGQDTSRSRFVDSFVSIATIGMNVEVANSRCTVVYVNGKYYGVYELGEDLNTDYLVTHYGSDPDHVDLVRYNGDVATHGSPKAFVKLRDSMKEADLSSEKKYAAFVEQVDEEYYIDYLIARTFFCDIDIINQKHWRVNDGTIRWRPLLFDMDMCCRSTTRVDIFDMYFSNEPVVSPHGYKSVFYLSYAFSTNKGFMQRFLDRYVEILYTQYSTERLLRLIDEMEAIYAPEMPRQISKWDQPNSIETWQKYVNVLRNFVKVRPDNIIKKLKKMYKLSDSEWNALAAKYTA